jgi:hypothetical protein
MKIALGCKAKDVVTGFEGVVTGFVRFITGCDQYCLSPLAKDGKMEQGIYFDSTRLEVTDPEVVKLPGFQAPDEVPNPG